MTEHSLQSAVNAVSQFLQSTEATYYKLILLVGKQGTGKTTVLHAVSEQLKTPVINTSFELSARLLELTTRQRALRLPEIFTEVIASVGKSVVLDNTEILFDRGLQQNPLRLLQSLSRNRQVIAAWDGTLEDGKLLYAEPDHTEYRQYAVNDIFVVDMNTCL
jgi:Cdc6-related protein, AAA superfamily ATPase